MGKRIVRKTRKDSAEGKVKAAKTVAGAAKGLEDGIVMPPSHVRLLECAMPYYKDIVRARARGLWNNGDLTRAANLAYTRYLIDKFNEDLELREGHTLENKRGTKVANPKFGIVEALTRKELALSRSLMLHAASQVEVKDAARFLEEEIHAQKIIEGISEEIEGDGDLEDLIPFANQMH